MRYLAQFSEAPQAKRVQSFWSDAKATEDWLLSAGKVVEDRTLVMRARGLRALQPWLAYQTQPLMIDAWLDPMELSATWNYVGPFLVGLGPERIWIPCGEDAWVGWMPGHIVVRAARQSWVWALVEDVWDPASWHIDQELEWWSEGRIQRAQRMDWGVVEQRSWLTGWEEWTLASNQTSHDESDERFIQFWFRLVDRLGDRPVRVKWLQETASLKEQLLGIDVRYVSCELTIKGNHPTWMEALLETQEPAHVRVQATWKIPTWAARWSTDVTLRRVQRGSRLEATYSPRTDDSLHAWMELRREQRQIPILQIRPLSLPVKHAGRWEDLEREYGDHQRRDALLRFLKTYRWRTPSLSEASRVRVPPGWTINRFESQPGLWVAESRHGIKAQIEWPTSAHPGHLGIIVGGVAAIPMSDWIRQADFNRLNINPRYWAQWATEILLPALDRFGHR